MTKSATETSPDRVLIFLLGSLGDTLIALPALRLIARRFPLAQRRMLTSFSVSEKAAPMSSLLDGTGLVEGYFRYPPRLRNPGELLKLGLSIRRWRPDLLIYLHEPRGRIVALRDAAYFHACGIRRLIGIPYGENPRKPRFEGATGLYEHRAEYLARRLAELGDSKLADRSAWSLALKDSERGRAKAELSPLRNCAGVLAISIGAKVDVKDWGDPNWLLLLHELSSRLNGWGLVIIGASSERSRSENLLTSWNGVAVNLCGSLSPRESGAVLELADVFVGHDSGPMHLAAAVGTPSVAVFSGQSLPGIWFPYGREHRPLYRRVECAGCGLAQCHEFKKKCIMSITVAEVATATLAAAHARADTARSPGPRPVRVDTTHS